MDRTIEILKEVMKEKRLSPEGVSRYIGCTPKSVYNWLKGERVPSNANKKAIMYAIMQIEKGELIITDSNLTQHDFFTDQFIYKRLKPTLTKKEKTWLLDVDGDYSEHRKRLYQLDEKYRNKKVKHG